MVHSGNICEYRTIGTGGYGPDLARNHYSVGIDFRRQNLTSLVDTHAVSVNIFIMAVNP